MLPSSCPGCRGTRAVVQLLPGASNLRIDRDGFTCRSLFRSWSVRWDEVDHFFVVSLRQSGLRVHQMVGWNHLVAGGSRGRRLSSALAGCEGALPDTCGMKAAALADHLNRCLERSRAG
jgi:hypothetical protein